MPVFRSADARASTRTSNHPYHLVFRSLGPRYGRSLQRAPGGYTHLFVATDKFTKWIEAKPVTTITAAKAKEFFQDIVVRFGVPNRIITDNGTQFTGSEFKDWCEELGITLLWHTHRATGRSSVPMAWCSRTSSQGSSIGSNLTRANGRENCHPCSGR